MTNSEIDLVEINRHDFRVLVRSFKSIPVKRMVPIIDLSIKNPESPQMFTLLAEVFVENLPVDKVDDFWELNMQEASDIIESWMNTEE